MWRAAAMLIIKEPALRRLFFVAGGLLPVVTPNANGLVDKRVQTQYLECPKYARIHSTRKQDYDGYSFLIDLSSNTLIHSGEAVATDSALYYVNGRTKTMTPSVYKISGVGEYKFYFKNNEDLSTDIYVHKQEIGAFYITKVNFAMINQASPLIRTEELNIESLTEIQIK